MGDFSYLGRAKLEQAQSLIASADSMFEAGRPEVALVSLKLLLDDVFDGGGKDGPNDGAVDQLATVVEALGGDEEQMAFLRASFEEDSDDGDLGDAAWAWYLKSYALDDLRDTVPFALSQLG